MRLMRLMRLMSMSCFLSIPIDAGVSARSRERRRAARSSRQRWRCNPTNWVMGCPSRPRHACGAGFPARGARRAGGEHWVAPCSRTHPAPAAAALARPCRAAALREWKRLRSDHRSGRRAMVLLRCRGSSKTTRPEESRAGVGGLTSLTVGLNARLDGAVGRSAVTLGDRDGRQWVRVPAGLFAGTSASSRWQWL